MERLWKIILPKNFAKMFCERVRVDKVTVLIYDQIRADLAPNLFSLGSLVAAIPQQQLSDIFLDNNSAAVSILGRPLHHVLPRYVAPGAADRKHTAVFVRHDKVVPFQSA